MVADNPQNLTGANMAGVGLLAIVPFVATIIGIYVISMLSDKTGKRRLWVMISLLCFAAALLASVVLRHNIIAAYIALVVCGFFLKAATSPFWSIQGELHLRSCRRSTWCLFMLSVS